MMEPAPGDLLTEALARLDISRQRQLEMSTEIARLTTELATVKRSLGTARRHLQVAEAARISQWEIDIPTGLVQLGTFEHAPSGHVNAEQTWALDALLAREHPHDLPILRRALQGIFEGRTDRYLVEHRVAAPDGWVWVESVGVVTQRDAKGMPTLVTGFNLDITARRSLHAEMEQARAQAEASNQAKSDFLASMSHEVRTPLNAVLGLTRLMQQSSLTIQQREYLDLIDRSAASLLTLLNDILDLSKIESGKLVFEQIRFDLGRWVRDAVALHAPAAESQGVQVSVDLADDVPQRVEGDPGRLRQIVSNLMSNAVKFTKQGRIVVAVRVAPHQVGLSPGQLRLLFTVRDTGIGISPDQQQQIFEAFSQADASTTRRFGGTGLGLAICARLVAVMGGVINVVSRPGEGSTFRFTAVVGVAADDDGAQSDPVPIDIMAMNGLDVLLAEDHAVNELLMRNLLAQMGCTVTVARDGKEAVERWQSRNFDLVLMDVQMPVLNGFDATARIRAVEARSPRLRRTPIVALTANAMAGDREKCLGAGMDAYVSKPVSLEKLAVAIRHARDAAALAPARVDVDIDFEITTGLGPYGEIDDEADDGERLEAAPSRAAPLAPAVDDTSMAVDMAQLMRNLDGDLDVLEQIADVMRTDMAQRRIALLLATGARDEARVMEQAHALKGALASIAAHRAAHASAAVQAAVRSGDWNAVQGAVGVLEKEIDRVDLCLAEIG